MKIWTKNFSIKNILTEKSFHNNLAEETSLKFKYSPHIPNMYRNYFHLEIVHSFPDMCKLLSEYC